MNGALWRQFEGQSIDSSYQLGELIGAGAFGGVFRADHVIEGAFVRRVAVKLIFPDPEHIQRQLGELIAATTIYHANTLRCFHAGSTVLGPSKLLYLVMELSEGTLQKRLEHGILPAEDVQPLLEQMSSALAYLHEQKRVHRDLKPANVLRVDGVWKLSDFGALRQTRAGATSHTGMVLGTLTYMPPESFGGVVSPAWDIWSLGVMLVQACTGKAPFEEPSEQQMLHAILHKEPQIPASLPETFACLARNCLVKDYRARWTNLQVYEELRRQNQSGSGDRRTSGRTRQQIESLLAQIDNHRVQRKWKEARLALEEAAEIAPGDSGVAALAREIDRDQERDEACNRRLGELRTFAGQARKEGDFDAAIRAWEEAAVLTPESEPQKEIGKLKQEQQVARLEKDAGVALAGKDYARAAKLLEELDLRGTSALQEPEPVVKLGPAKRVLVNRAAAGLALCAFASAPLWKISEYFLHDHVMQSSFTYRELFESMTLCAVFVLLARQRASAWPLYLANHLFFLFSLRHYYLDFDAATPAKVGGMIWVITLALIGFAWWKWSSRDGKTSLVTRMPVQTGMLLGLGAIVVCFAILKLQGMLDISLSWARVLEVATVPLFWFALYALARKFAQAWWGLIAGSAIELIDVASEGQHIPAALVRILFIAVGIFGLVRWHAASSPSRAKAHAT